VPGPLKGVAVLEMASIGPRDLPSATARVGNHSLDVLAALGLDASGVDSLCARKVVP
jgi:hypothetical protein